MYFIQLLAGIKFSALPQNAWVGFEAHTGPSSLGTVVQTYIQKDATLHSLLSLEIALHVSGGISTHHQERIQLYLQHVVLVKP